MLNKKDRAHIYYAGIGHRPYRITYRIQDVPLFPLRSTVTGEDGHTPLPHNREHTLIVAHYVLDQNGRRAFTYTIKVATPDGSEKVVTGISLDENWYRPDLMKPTRTIKVVMP